MDEKEIDEDDLEENEVAFFKCAECGSRVLDVVQAIDVTESVESVLPCTCGEEEQAAVRTERVTRCIENSGYLRGDRHIVIEEREEIDELDREEETQITYQRCYEMCKDQNHLWDQVDREEDEDEEGADLTITCGGCGREIEFGYSHPNKQGRIFLGNDDSDFNPWKTFPDDKYVDKWEGRGWLRPKRRKGPNRPVN